MKQLIPVLIGGAVLAVVLLRPLPPPAATTASAGSWSADAPGLRGKHDRRTAPSRAMVYVAGEVVRPGVYPVGPEARVRDALALAGGAKPDGDLVAVNLAAHASDGDEIVVPVRGAVDGATGAPSGRGHRRRRRRGGADPGGASFGRADRAAGHGKHRRAHGRGAPPSSQVDINTADADTLATIPGTVSDSKKRVSTWSISLRF